MAVYIPASPVAILGAIPSIDPQQPTVCQESLAVYLLSEFERLNSELFQVSFSCDEANTPLNSVLKGGYADLPAALYSRFTVLLDGWAKFNDLYSFISGSASNLTASISAGVQDGASGAFSLSNLSFTDADGADLSSYCDSLVDALGDFEGDIHSYVSEDGLPVPVEPSLPPVSIGSGSVWGYLAKVAIRFVVRRVIRSLLEKAVSGGNPNTGEQIAEAIRELKASGIGEIFSLEIDSGLGQKITMYPSRSTAEEG